MFHHNTIRRYTLALLDFFNDVEIQYKDSNGALVTKKIPIQYRNKEKYEMMDKSFQQEISGNMEVLPRGTLNLTQMSRSSDRNTSKYNKFNKFKGDDIIQTMYNPVPYDFMYDRTILDYKKIVDDYVKDNDWIVKESSTVTYSVGGLILSNS